MNIIKLVRKYFCNIMLVCWALALTLASYLLKDWNFWIRFGGGFVALTIVYYVYRSYHRRIYLRNYEEDEYEASAYAAEIASDAITPIFIFQLIASTVVAIVLCFGTNSPNPLAISGFVLGSLLSMILFAPFLLFIIISEGTQLVSKLWKAPKTTTP